MTLQWMRRSMLLTARAVSVLLGLLLIFSTMAPVRAHVGLHAEIETVSQRIRQDPGNPQFYLKRGDLHRVHRNWADALTDFQHARELNPELAEVDLGAGRTYFDQGRYRKAVETLGHFLARQPGNVRGLVTRAGAHRQLDESLAAAADYNAAIAQFRLPQRPLPEYYLERAHAYAAAGDQYIDIALQGLEEGIQRLGSVTSLELYAIELERKRSHYDAALDRLTQIVARSPRKESWLVQRGEILIEAGQITQGVDDFDAALAAIEGLPPARRATRWVEKLRVRIQANLESLGYARPPLRINASDAINGSSIPDREVGNH